MARAPELVRHPGIEQECIRRLAVRRRGLKVGWLPQPQGFPHGAAQALPQLPAALRAFLAVQLDHLMAVAGIEFVELGIARIGHHQHPLAARSHCLHGFEQGLALRGVHKPGRGIHSDHPHGIDPKRCHRPHLGTAAQPADFQQWGGQGGSLLRRPF